MGEKPFKNIAIAIAESPNFEANIYESIRIKKMIGQQLFLIHVGDYDAQLEKRIKEVIASSEGSVDNVEIVWQKGDPAQVILEVAKQKNIDLIIAGAMPREGLVKYYMGSVARRLVRASNCSILLMTHPSKLKSTCGCMVVNGLNHPKTSHTVKMAIRVANSFGARKVTVVQEVAPKMVSTKIEDENSIAKLQEEKAEIERCEKERISDCMKSEVLNTGLTVEQKCIFGKKGYTIGHFAETTKADLLVMNSPDTKLGFLDRVFTHDLEYILSELPCDLLIVHSKKNRKG